MAFLDYDGLKRYTEKFKSWVSGSFVPKTPTSWAEIQREVQLGHGAVLFPVGSQLTLTHSVYGDIVMDVVSHDTVKKAKLSEDGQAQYDADGKIAAVENAHTMTLMAHDQVLVRENRWTNGMRFDAAEMMYYAESGLAAGTYNFTVPTTLSLWTAGTYQFTLTKDAPAPSWLKIGGNEGYAWKYAITDLKMNVFETQTQADSAAYESVAITSGSAGTSLGTLGTELNHTERISYGSNNYKESSVRQWLNSEAAYGSVWTPQTHFDRAPQWVTGETQLTEVAGFLNGCPADFLDAIATAVVKCAANNVYEAPDSTVTVGSTYELADRVFIPSLNEVGLTYSYAAVDDSTLFQFFDGASDADRIKYFNGSANCWMVRTCDKNDAYGGILVTAAGGVSIFGAVNISGVTPCVIIA